MSVTGSMTASKLFDVYGAMRSLSGTPTTRQGFVGGLGHESDDETGLVYMQHRYLDPGIGRFISEDQAKQEGNWFSYCGSDPVNRIDPDGKIWLTDSAIGFMVKYLGADAAKLAVNDEYAIAELEAAIVQLQAGETFDAIALAKGATTLKTGQAMENGVLETQGAIMFVGGFATQINNIVLLAQC